MQNQLNYYSRYNRIKVEDKKQIPSLYSLLSHQTLTKLAHDAQVSLQMISLYKKEKLYHSVVGDHETDQSEYLQANNLFTFRSFQSESVDRKHSRNQKKKSLVSIKKKTKFNQKNEQQKLSKQAYLENLVLEVRSKSIERIKTNLSLKEQLKRHKKSKQKKLKSERQNAHRQTYHNALQDQLANSNHNNMNIDIKKPVQIAEKSIQKKLIKSLISQQQNSVKYSIQNNKIQIQGKQIRKEYVESIDDGNEKQLSGPSIVLERLNFKVSDTPLVNIKDQMKQKVVIKKNDNESKEDNPSSNDGKQSDIKSFSKEIEILKKPFKNLIELQLNHSQSQIWEPEQRSLEIPYRQFETQKIQQVQEGSSTNQQKPNAINELQKTFQAFSGIQQTNEIQNKVHFLSQINQQKQVQQPPYEHPLETGHYFPQQQIGHFPVPVKKSFKKFILNKQLNARLVTSTILNERNQRNSLMIKQRQIKQINENQNQIERPSQPLQQQQRSDKINFKALINKKKEALKQESSPIKMQKPLPLRKLQNQKLLQEFFNNN